MSEPLYSIDILRLASETGRTPLLFVYDARAERRSATCGSRITVDICVDADGRVSSYGHDPKACALGQAASTILARSVIGKSLDDLRSARDALITYLSGASDAPPNWPQLSVLYRARSHTARHASIQLPFETAVEAMERVAL